MTIRKLFLGSLLGAAFACLSHSATGGDWPSFRGPHGTGETDAANLPTEWSKEKNIKWFYKLPGPANSSPIVSNGRVFVTCAENEGKKRNLYCIDRKTGKQVWVESVDYDKAEVMHKTNHHSGATPAADGERVVVWHGSAGLYCYSFAGKLQWKATDMGPFTHIWGFGSSPIIHKGKVFLNAGPGKTQFIAAFNLNDGKLLWKKDEPGGSDSRKGRLNGSWSTPIVRTIDDKEQLICSMSTRVLALDPETGETLWELGGLEGSKGDLMYTSPVFRDNVGVVMGGYSGPIVAFRLGGSGDVTEKNTVWKSERPQPQRIGSGVVVGDYIYVANADSGTANCFHLETGMQMWRERLGNGAHWGSIVHADGKLYVTNQRGVTHVFKPNPEKFERLATNDLKEPSNSTPAISDGELFIRTARGLYCIGNGDK